MTEVPEHLLQRSRDARARLTGEGGDEAAAAPAEDTAGGGGGSDTTGGGGDTDAGPTTGGDLVTLESTDGDAAVLVVDATDDTEDAWHPVFRDGNARYQEPTLVLFTDRVQSACGF